MKGVQLFLSKETAGAEEPGELEEQGYVRGFQCIAGLDEVGRGPLAGPVVAAAVVLPRGFTHPGIKDSKMLTADQRVELAPVIRDRALSWSLGVVEVEEIDRINILEASLLAMAHALCELPKMPDYVLVDGAHEIPAPFFMANDVARPSLPRQVPVVKGDRRSVSIAAASILAKVARDELMMGLDRDYPGYGFGQHKGYGSAAHLEALRRLGPSPVHRMSFKPVRQSTARSDHAEPDLLFVKG